MNNLQELEKLNSLSFKLLIFLPLINFLGSLLLAKAGFSFQVIYIFYLACVILQIIIFTPISTLNKLFKLNRRITTFFIHNDADRM